MFDETDAQQEGLYEEEKEEFTSKFIEHQTYNAIQQIKKTRQL